MIITDIKQQVKDSKRVSIFIDNKFAFGISCVDALYYKLKTGDEISQEKYNKIIDETIFVKARDKALKLLGIRARSKKEIVDRLKSDYSEEIIDRVIDVLEKYNYINDTAFAEMYAKEKFRMKGWSKKRIYFELRQKGINENTINTVLENSDFDTYSAIEKLLAKRLKGKHNIDFKEQRKQFNYLLSKGYEYDEITEALKKYI